MHEANVEPSRLPVHHWHGELDELLRIDRVRIRARGEDSFGRPGAAPVRRTCKPQLGPEKHRRRSLLEAGPGDIEVGPVVIAWSWSGGNPLFVAAVIHRGHDCVAPGPPPVGRFVHLNRAVALGIDSQRGIVEVALFVDSHHAVAKGSAGAPHRRHKAAGKGPAAVIRCRKARKENFLEHYLAGWQADQLHASRAVIADHYVVVMRRDGGLALGEFHKRPQPSERLDVVERWVVYLHIVAAELDLLISVFLRDRAGGCICLEHNSARQNFVRHHLAFAAQLQIDAVLLDRGEKLRVEWKAGNRQNSSARHEQHTCKIKPKPLGVGHTSPPEMDVAIIPAHCQGCPRQARLRCGPRDVCRAARKKSWTLPQTATECLALALRGGKRANHVLPGSVFSLRWRKAISQYPFASQAQSVGFQFNLPSPATFVSVSKAAWQRVWRRGGSEGE